MTVWKVTDRHPIAPIAAMSALSSAMRAVAYACHMAHGSADEIHLQRVGDAASVATPATAYREQTEWRRTANDREQVFTRRVILLPDAAPVPIGSLFSVGGHTYTVEHVSAHRIGSQTLRGVRSAAANVSRPNYYDRS